MLLLSPLKMTMESTMKTIIKFTAYILILLMASGCNGDVFIDDFRTSDTHLILSGNGDAKVIHFAASNWDLTGVYAYTDNFSYPYKIYDADGNLVSRGEMVPYLEGFGKIESDDVKTAFNIERCHSKELKITVSENARSGYFRFILIVGNEYESQEIFVEITPSNSYVPDLIND